MTKAKRTIPEVERLAAESECLRHVINTASDLACALIVGASVEKATMALVGKHLVDGTTTNELLSERGPLGSFASCRKLAYCLGLISKGMSLNLGHIGDIRNFFAHNNVTVTFDNELITSTVRLATRGFAASRFLKATCGIQETLWAGFGL